ncbi:MAG: SDR family oxidoreductase [Planctomycetota bacterium]
MSERCDRLPLTRRGFLASAAALSARGQGPSLAPTPRRSAPPPEKLSILILGGTGFLGPAIVEAALARGHILTLFNRGKTNPDLFPDVEKLRGQRRRPSRAGAPPQDLEALKGRDWDAVVDTSGYFTGEVEDSAKLLAGHAKHYTFVSSLSVYRNLESDDSPIDEQSPLAECEDKYATSMGRNYERYGALKRYCEEAAERFFPGRTLRLRPGYIVGPRDNSDRFTWWPVRIRRGGECIGPGDPDNELQFIDVRDLGEFVVHAIERSVTGPVNAVGFDGRISVAEFLYCAKGTLNHRCSFTWVSDEFLERNGVQPWGSMPCWTPKKKNGHASNRRAIEAGMAFRPIAETIRATADWAEAERPSGRPWRTGLTPEREKELLEKWKSR